LCEPVWRLTAVRTVGARRSGHLSRSWATASSLSPGREAELRPGGLCSVRCDRSRPRTVTWKLRQRPQIRWHWRREACFSGWAIRGWSWLKRLQVGQPGSAVFRIRLARRLAGFYSRGSHEGTEINVRFRRSRRSTPSDYSDGHEFITRRSFEPELGEPIPTSWVFAGPPRRARSTIVAGATRPPGGG
jgi:hypothetical protein